MSNVVLISGYRDFNDYKLFTTYLNEICDLGGVPRKSVFGDCPTGADALALRYVKEHKNCVYTRYIADWRKYGRAAGPIRNQVMIDIEHPNIGIFFMSKQSKGTKQCLEYARAKKVKRIYVIDTDETEPSRKIFDSIIGRILRRTFWL